MTAITIVCSIQHQLVTGQNEILSSTALPHLNKTHAFLNRRFVQPARPLTTIKENQYFQK